MDTSTSSRRVRFQSSEPKSAGDNSARARDLVALLRQEELRAAAGDWPKVLELLEERCEGLADPTEQARELAKAASICLEYLSDRERAFELACRGFAASAEAAEPIAQLETLCLPEHAMAEACIDVFARAATSCSLGAPELATSLWLRVAALELERRADPARAISAIGRADADSLSPQGEELITRIERAARSAAVLDALGELCRDAGDYTRQLHALLRSLDCSRDTRDLVQRHRKIARLLESCGEADCARWHQEHAQLIDPSSGQEPSEAHERLAAVLADQCFRQGRFHQAEPLLQRLYRPGSAIAERLGLARADVAYHGARTALELGRYDRARDLYRETLEHDPVHLPSLIGLAHASVELRDWEQAHDCLGEALLLQRSEGCHATELAETLFGMGMARQKAGDLSAALTLYRSALLECPYHVDSVRAAAGLFRRSGDMDAVADILTGALGAGIEDDADCFDLTLELAAVKTRFTRDYQGAIALCKEAFAHRPGDRRVLLQLIESCEAAGSWHEAIAAAVALAKGEDNRFTRGTYYQLAGAIAEHVSIDEAARHLDAALDCYFAPDRVVPRSLRSRCWSAFEAQTGLLREHSRFKQLEQCYRAMIKRLPPEAVELGQLWSELGKVYREHLGHQASAIKSFEIASSLEQDRLTHHRILIDLYQGLGTDELDKLIARRRLLLQAEPFNPEHYSALRKLWAQTKQRDRTYCACRALAFLGRADRMEDEFFRRNRPAKVTWPSRPLDAEDWALLRHPAEDPRISAVMRLLVDPIALDRAVPARRLRLRDDRSPCHDRLRRLATGVAHSLGVNEPTLYVMPELSSELVLANVRARRQLQLSFAAGSYAYQGRSGLQMVQALARAFSHLRGEAYLRLLLGGSGQLAAILPAVRAVLVRPGSTQCDVRDPIVADTHQALGRWADRDIWIAELRAALRRLRERPGSIDLDSWGRGIDATARRAGLLLAGDLETAAYDLRREPSYARQTSHDQKVADILLHSVSDEHLELRAKLGLAIS